MKKLITLFAVLLVGAGSVFAQYDVDVSWSYDSPYNCQSQLSSDYEFKITLDIYDVVNDVQVVNVSNTEDWDETGTTFTPAQTGIEDWCDKATSTPNLRIAVMVEMVHKTTQNVYCYKYAVQYNITCNWCSNNAVIFDNIVFY